MLNSSASKNLGATVPGNRCVYVDGYFVVEGEASFVRCEVGGGGESSPGPGGAMYVGPTGSVLFADTVHMSEVSIIDDEGNNGGGIYNEGKVRYGRTPMLALFGGKGGQSRRTLLMLHGSIYRQCGIARQALCRYRLHAVTCGSGKRFR